MRATESSPPRFFVALDLVPATTGTTIELPAAVAHHAVRVVRLAPGDPLTLFTGRGGEYAATLSRVDKRAAAVRIERFDPVERESPLAMTLAQGVTGNDAMDYAVRKAVELGAAAIQPLLCARSAPFPSGERGERRVAHWRQIAIAGCEQCGRNRVPKISSPQPLAEWLTSWSGSGFVLTPAQGAALASQPAPGAPVALLIGPEGGLDTGEIRLAQARGFVAVRIGPRVLRTDTAAVAALGALQLLWGDLR
jgi:16S rRNA (uracil1498-N3)-methyltransferase